MKTTNRFVSLALLATFATTAVSPVLADEASSQKHKNNWRNGALAGAAVLGYGLVKHDRNATILGAAGGAYAASRYENDRKHQDARKRARARYHRRSYYRNGVRYYYRTQ